MEESQLRFDQLIHHLRALTGLECPIEYNSCTLVDKKGDEKLVLEYPENSDLLLLHRLMLQLPSDPQIRAGRALQLLHLNSQPAKLRGAWFCIDSEAQAVHLMFGQPLKGLTGEIFENLIFNYVELADQLAEELRKEERELLPPNNDHKSGIQV